MIVKNISRVAFVGEEIRECFSDVDIVVDDQDDALIGVTHLGVVIVADSDGVATFSIAP